MKPKLFIIALLAILVASCTREPLPLIKNEGSIATINVSISPETRVAYDDLNLKLSWENDDKLLLAGYDALGNYKGKTTFTYSGTGTVSYTHLDVYKRQRWMRTET